jgi:hypothetical protein
MKFWRTRGLYFPVDLREHADLGADYSDNSLWPDCYKCTKLKGMPVKVVSYGVEDTGLTITGIPYTDFMAECNHGGKTKEKDIIRIEGFRWDDWEKDGYSGDTVARLAAIKALPFFHEGVNRCIPASVYRNFLNSWKK